MRRQHESSPSEPTSLDDLASEALSSESYNDIDQVLAAIDNPLSCEPGVSSALVNVHTTTSNHHADPITLHSLFASDTLYEPVFDELSNLQNELFIYCNSPVFTLPISH